MRKAGFLVLTVALALVVLVSGVVGCGGDEASPTPQPTKTPGPTGQVTQTPAPATQTPAPTAQKTGVIKFGVVTPLSGPAAGWGIPHMRSFELAFDIANEQGGVTIGDTKYTFEAVGYDSKIQADEAITVVNKLIYQDGVKYLSVLDLVAPIRDICRKEGILQINLAWQYEGHNPNYPLMFHYLQEWATSGAVISSWIHENYPEVKTSVGLGPDYSTGYGCQEMFARAMEYWGVETADIFYFDPTTTDFSSIMINILALEPDFIHLGGAPATQAAAAIKAARELGYTGMMGCIGDGSQSLPAFVDLAGGAANVAGYVAGSNGGPVDESSFTPAMLEWKERYEETYNEPFNPTTMDWSMGAFTLVDGIRAAKSLEPEDIAEALRSPDFVGENLWGEYTYGMKEIYGLDQNIVCPISYFQYGDDGVPHDVLIAYPDEYMPIAIQMNLGGENISWK